MGTLSTKPKMVPHIVAWARRLSFAKPCSTACSPLVSATNSNATDSATKPQMWSELPKVHSLNSGDMAMVKTTPAMPSHSDHRRTAVMTREMCPCSAAFSWACEMSRTLLWRIPRLVAVLSMSRAWLNRPKSPMPTGPIHIATSLVRTIEQIMPII